MIRGLSLRVVGPILVAGGVAACSGGAEPTKSTSKSAANSGNERWLEEQHREHERVGSEHAAAGECSGRGAAGHAVCELLGIRREALVQGAGRGVRRRYGSRSPASNPSAVKITKVKLTTPGDDQGTWFFAETKKAGTVTLTASSKGKTADATLTVKSYDAASYDTGKTRYMNGSDDGKDPACTQCHDASNGGIDHHHVGRDCRFVDEHEASSVKPALLANPVSARASHVGSLALCRPQAFF